jgi:hypothetical protein
LAGLLELVELLDADFAVADFVAISSRGALLIAVVDPIGARLV